MKVEIKENTTIQGLEFVDVVINGEKVDTLITKATGGAYIMGFGEKYFNNEKELIEYFS